MGVMDRDELIEAADHKNFMDVLLHVAQDELPLGRAELLGRDEKHPQAGTADEVQTAEIDDHAQFAFADVLHDDGFECACVRAVDPVDRQQYEDVIVSFFNNFNVHRYPSSSGRERFPTETVLFYAGLRSCSKVERFLPSTNS